MGLPNAAGSGKRSSSRSRAAILAAILASLTGAWPASTQAAPYDVEICTFTAPGEDGIRFAASQGSTLTRFGCGNPFDGGLRLAGGAAAANGEPHRGLVQWTLTAPPGTTIRTLDANRVFPAWGDAGLRWEVAAGGGTVLETVIADGQPAPPNADITYVVNSDSVTGRLICPSGAGCKGSLGVGYIVSVLNVIAHMEDNSPPSLTGALGGSLLAGGKVSGTREVSFSATDSGAGIAEAALLVDGAEVAKLANPNGGKCVRPYKFLVPCLLSIDSSFPLDTTKLTNGGHNVQIAIVDAARQRALSASVDFSVENGGAPGGGAPPGGGPQGDGTAPVLSAVSLSRTRWKAGARGTLLRYMSSEAGQLALGVERVRRGGQAKRLANLTRAIEAGAGNARLGPRIGGKALTPGRYRVTVTARDAAGNVSPPVRRSFTILPG